MAVGFNAFATGSNTTALGTNSAATASGATAVGQNAQATFAGSAAFGSGASATAANQQSFGTATSTYAFPGITSAASAAAQIGTTQLVTTDSAGRLASDGGATASAIATAQTTANTAQTTANTAQTTANTAQTTATAAQTTANTALTTANTALAAASGFQNQINDLYNHERKLMQGIAMAAAVPQSIVLPGENFSLSIEWANYGPANAVGLSSAVRLGAFAMGGAKVGVQGNVGVGIGVDGGSQTVTRAGVRLGW